MRWLRGALIADPAIIISTMVFATASVALSFFDSTGRIPAAVARAWAKFLLLASGVQVTVEGLENIDPNGSYIFMSNHTSYIDTPVVLANISAQFRFLAKRGLFQIPIPRNSPEPRWPHPRSARGSSRRRQDSPTRRRYGAKEKNLIVRFSGRRALSRWCPHSIQRRWGLHCDPRRRTCGATGSHRRNKVLPYGAGIVKSGSVTLRILPPIETSGLNAQRPQHAHRTSSQPDFG